VASGPLREAGAQWLPVDQLHCKEGAAVGFTELVDRRHVGMREGRGSPRLAREALAALLVGQCVHGQDLQGDVAPKPRIARAVDLAMPPAPRRATTSYEAEAGARARVKDGT